MTDLDKTLAAAREALSYHYKRAEFSDTPMHALDAIGALDDLLLPVKQAPPAAAVPPSFVATCARLRALVEGVGCERWADSKGRRLKDTEEWVAFYVELSAMLAAAERKGVES